MRCADCGKTVYSTAFACPWCGGEKFTKGKEQRSQGFRSRFTGPRCADCGAEIPWGRGACPRCGGEGMLHGSKPAASVQEQPARAEHSAPPLEVPSDPAAAAKRPDAAAKRRRVCRKCGWKLGKADETCAWCGSAEFYEEVFDTVTMKFRPVSAPVSQNDEAQREAPASVSDNPADGPDESEEARQGEAVSRSAPSEAWRPARATRQKYCTDCGKKIPRGNDACPRCGGTRLGDLDAILHQRRCGDCGRDVPGESEFCTYCFSQNIIAGIPPAGYTLERE